MMPDGETETLDRRAGAGRTWLLAGLVALFLALSGLYNVSVPRYESPDELQHAAFVAWLADDRGLPVVDPEDPGPWEQEGTQPPLYYWIVARLVGWLPHEAAGDLAGLNPYAGIGDPQRPDNKNRVLHDAVEERWPSAPVRDGLFVHLARAVSSLMATGTLLAIYALGRIVFPARRGIAWGMAALVAFIPQYLFLSASINNDNLVILLASWVLVVLARWLRAPGRPGWLALAGLGLLLGLAALAKFSGVLLWPLAGCVLAWLAWRERDAPAGARGFLGWLLPAGLLVFALALALSAWWFVRNLSLYDDLSALGPHLAIMGSRRRLPSVAQAARELRGFRLSFWALFGWFNILVPEPFYWIMDGFTLVGLVGLVVALAQSWRRLSRGTRQVLALLVAWLALVLVGVVRWTLMTPASQGRLLYPALAAIALFLIAGWATLLRQRFVPGRWRRPLVLAALAAWPVWAALCVILWIRPAYALPERVASTSELGGAPATLQVRYGDCCELVGYDQPAEPVYPGDWVPLRLVWRVVEETDRDYTLFVHATTAGGQVVGQLDTYHGGGMYPTSQWQAGEVIDDVAWVPISWQARGPALIRFNVGLHEPDGAGRLPITTPGGQAVEVVFAGEAALLPFAWPEVETLPETGTVFEDRIALAAVDLPPGPVQAGEVVTVTLHWQALSAVGEDLTGFVHLIAADGADVTQDDHQPLDGGFPTRLWDEGAVIADPYHLELPAGLAPGAYGLWGGFYRPGTVERLPAVSRETGERWQDDLVYLGALTVVAQEP